MGGHYSPENIMRRYKEAYAEANGRDIQITYNRGWYRIFSYGTCSKYRARQILEFTDRLRERTPTQGDR